MSRVDYDSLAASLRLSILEELGRRKLTLSWLAHEMEMATGALWCLLHNPEYRPRDLTLRNLCLIANALGMRFTVKLTRGRKK